MIVLFLQAWGGWASPVPSGGLGQPWHPVLSSHYFGTSLPATQSPVSFVGYPEPEVTWYKDDTELDRYCGLPKYQITHQGNRHTLQLYR